MGVFCLYLEVRLYRSRGSARFMTVKSIRYNSRPPSWYRGVGSLAGASSIVAAASVEENVTLVPVCAHADHDRVFMEWAADEVLQMQNPRWVQHFEWAGGVPEELKVITLRCCAHVETTVYINHRLVHTQPHPADLSMSLVVINFKYCRWHRAW